MLCMDPFTHKSQNADSASPTQKLKRYNVALEPAKLQCGLGRFLDCLAAYSDKRPELNYWNAMSPYVTCIA